MKDKLLLRLYICILVSVLETLTIFKRGLSKEYNIYSSLHDCF